MRPIKLSLRGFTAYRDEQTLDFDGLDLFAITGPTGSGKTSLLDALTYALFGTVPRMSGDLSMRDLISAGQPRLSVSLEFEVEREGYRITRSTPRKGQTKVLLERRVGDEWESFGEGADRIREVKEAVTGLLGVNYDAFTRSVLLPQGQFHEFLSGDAKKRRDILTELLGLELFDRMARQAGGRARHAKTSSEAKAEVLAEQFRGVDEAAVKEARRQAETAVALSESLSAAETSIETMHRRWEAGMRRIEELSALAEEAESLGSSAESIAIRTDELLIAVREAEEGRARAEAGASRARERADAASATFVESQARLGSLEDLAATRTSLGELGRIQDRLRRAQASAEDSQESLERAEITVEEAGRALATAGKAHEEATEALATAEEEREHARRHDLVADLTHGLSEGDPCPVCERPLSRVPSASAGALSRAEKALNAARKAEKQASQAVTAAERAVALAERDREAARQGLLRCRSEVAGAETERNEVGAAVVEFFGGKLPEDPLGEVDSRISELRRLKEEAEKAIRSAEDADRRAGEARKAAEGLVGTASSLVAELRALPTAGLLQRVRRVAPDLEVPAPLVGSIPSDVETASDTARQWSAAFREAAKSIEATADEVRTEAAALLDQALRLVPPGVDRPARADLGEVLAMVRAEARQAVAGAATARTDADRLAQRLAERRKLAAEVETLAREATLYRALAVELRADHLVDFLQGEALELLAAAGSERLVFLSRDRYRLAYEDDEFYVEDRQNGDERRSVRTLSGGETFLASLALALALSEQIQSLAVTEKARLDSLFIDEGFGALDPENLDIASAAIDQLGGGGRMVGVITHVWELAERLPVRVEVEKLPRGSRFRVVS